MLIFRYHLKLIKMKNNNKIYITLLIFALVSLVLIVFFVWPLFKEIEKNSDDLISAKNNIVVLGIQNSETGNFKKNYVTYKPNLDKIDQLFMDPVNPVDFIKFLEDTAGDSQITSQISLQPAPKSSQQTSQNFILFQFSTTGNFSSVLDFAKKIEAGPYLIEIENLTIQNSRTYASSSPQGGSSIIVSGDYSSRKVDAVFAIKAFVQK